MSQSILSDSTFISAIFSGLVALGIYLKTTRDKRLQADTDRLFDERLRLRETEFQRLSGTVEAALQKELVQAEQIIAAESLLDEEALSLYGIILDPASQDPVPTPSRIRYLVAIVNAQNMRYDHTESDSTKLNEMFDEDYMPRLFAQPITREVWRHARRCFRKILRDNIDKYVIKTYPKEYETRPMQNLDAMA